MFKHGDIDDDENEDVADEDETSEDIESTDFEQTFVNHTQVTSEVVEFKIYVECRDETNLRNDQKYYWNELKKIYAFEEVMHVWVNYNSKCAKKGVFLQTFV